MEGGQNNIESNIDWGPLKKGGSSFKTHKLVEISSQRLEYKASVGSIAFGGLFTLVGIGIIIASFMVNNGVLLSLFGLVFGSVGGFILYQAFKPIVFDKSVGYFWKGKQSPHQVSDISAIKVAATFDDIYGIQVIKEFVKGSSGSGSSSRSSSYYSYEINLILNSGQRLNVVDYGNANAIIEDASKISKFLNKPVLTQN